MAAHFPNLSAEEQTQLLESTKGPKWWNLVQWVRQALIKRGEIDILFYLTYALAHVGGELTAMKTMLARFLSEADVRRGTDEDARLD